MHVTFAMLPSERNHTSITCKGYNLNKFYMARVNICFYTEKALTACILVAYTMGDIVLSLH